jgi:hypothetical protein
MRLQRQQLQQRLKVWKPVVLWVVLLAMMSVWLSLLGARCQMHMWKTVQQQQQMLGHQQQVSSIRTVLQPTTAALRKLHYCEQACC